MSGIFIDRERAAETAFVHDEELRFLAHRRATQALGAWTAECLGFDAEATRTYVAGLVDAVFGGLSDERLVERVQTDLERAGKPSLTTQVATVFSRAVAEAFDELRGRTEAPATEDALDSWAKRHPASSAWGSLRF